VNNFLRILAGLMDLLVKRGRRKEQEDAQAEADHINDDPAGWYADHFRVQPKVTGGDATDPSETHTK
jgi:hypothetical protein